MVSKRAARRDKPPKYALVSPLSNCDEKAHKATNAAMLVTNFELASINCASVAFGGAFCPGAFSSGSFCEFICAFYNVIPMPPLTGYSGFVSLKKSRRMTESEYKSTVRCFKVAVLGLGVFTAAVACGALIGWLSRAIELRHTRFRLIISSSWR